MPGSRSLSQRISEGDGIAIIVCVADAAGARAAEEQGAKAIAVDAAVDGIREATNLPLLWLGEGAPVDADACAIRADGGAAAGHARTDGAGLETVVDVRDEEELEVVLETLDPEIFLLSSRHDDRDDPLDAVLELLPDVPAGKLAIAELLDASADDVQALERAGIDAVLVGSGHIGELVGARPPEV